MFKNFLKNDTSNDFDDFDDEFEDFEDDFDGVDQSRKATK